MSALEEVRRAKTTTQKAAQLIVDVKHDLHMLEQRITHGVLDACEVTRISDEVTRVMVLLNSVQESLRNMSTEETKQ